LRIQRGKSYDAVVSKIVFSSNGASIAYAAREGEGGFIVTVDRDGNVDEGAPYDWADSPVFSSDSKKLAYLVRGIVTSFIVVDGIEGASYDNIGRPVFSPDSQTVSYAAFRGGELYIVHGDVEESKQYNLVTNPFYSPDGQSGYVGSLEGKSFIVVNNKEGKLSDGTIIGTPIFSPDSKTVAYVMQQDEKLTVVVEDTEGMIRESKQYDQITFGPKGIPITFSPDSKKIAYGVVENGKSFMVVDDGSEQKEGKKFDVAVNAVFSDDNQEVAYRAIQGENYLMVINGKESKMYDWVSAPVFTSAGNVAYGALSDSELWWIVDDVS